MEHCTTNENLLIRAVKFYERRGDLDQARHLLSRTKHLSINKSWKTVLEGALLEARVGRYSMAVSYGWCSILACAVLLDGSTLTVTVSFRMSVSSEKF